MHARPLLAPHLPAFDRNRRDAARGPSGPPRIPAAARSPMNLAVLGSERTAREALPAVQPAAVRTRRPLSVLHLITRLDRGGSSDCTLLQAMGTARRGWRVTVAAGPTSAPSPLLERARDAPGVRLVEIPALARPLNLRHDIHAFRQIVALLRSER